MHAKGLSCREARGIERYAAHHDWIPFRLYHRTWTATIYSHAHHHTYVRFHSGRLIVWITGARATPKGGGLPLGSGCCAGPRLAGYFASSTPVALPRYGAVAIGELQVGEQVMSTDASGKPIAAAVSLIGCSPSAASSRALYTRYGDDPTPRDLIASPNALFGNGKRADELVPGMDSLQDPLEEQITIGSTAFGAYSGAMCRLGVAGTTGTFFANGVLVDGWQI